MSNAAPAPQDLSNAIVDTQNNEDAQKKRKSSPASLEAGPTKLRGRRIVWARLSLVVGGVETHPFLAADNYKDLVLARHLIVWKPFAETYGQIQAAWDKVMEEMALEKRPDNGKLISVVAFVVSIF